MLAVYECDSLQIEPTWILLVTITGYGGTCPKSALQYRLTTTSPTYGTELTSPPPEALAERGPGDGEWPVQSLHGKAVSFAELLEPPMSPAAECGRLVLSTALVFGGSELGSGVPVD